MLKGEFSMKLTRLLPLLLLPALILPISCDLTETDTKTLTITTVGDGIVTGASNGSYEVGKSFTLSATANSGSEFNHWTDSTITTDSSSIWTVSTYTFVLTKDTVITATFSELAAITFNLTIEVVGNGTVSGGTSGTYSSGRSFTLVAAPNDSNTTKFSGWSKGGNKLSSSASYTFSIEADMVLTATFIAWDPNAVNVQTWSHTFNQSADFKKEGGSTLINGLTWTYSPFAFLGQNGTVGVHIGSGSSPQTTDWNFRAEFGGIVNVLSFGFVLCGAASSNFDTTINLGSEYTLVQNTRSNELVTYSFEELNESTDYFSFTLKSLASKAIYLNSLSFTVEVPNSLDLAISVDQIVPIDVTPGVNGIPAIIYPTTSKETYYSGINLSATGAPLLTSLRTKISDMNKTSYEQAKNMLVYTDESYDDPGFLRGMWDGDLLPAKWGTGVWDREHVWACSNMGLGGDNRPGESTRNHGTDLHNLRAACQGSNGAHSNKHFGNPGSGHFYPTIAAGSLNGVHECSGNFNGDLARILLYMYVRYDFLTITENPHGNNNTGILSHILQWHNEDPVDDFEIQRNNRIFNYQNNRNPFIDYPALANQLVF